MNFPHLMNLKEKQVREIAEYLSSDSICFLHKKTGEIIFFPREIYEYDDECIQEAREKIEDNIQDYLKFEPMDSHQAFLVLKKFVEEIVPQDLQEEFFSILSGAKPFRNFKNHIDRFDVLRQQWFDFQQEQNIQWVEKYIDSSVIER